MAKKKYLYEVDLMRCIFIFMVLLNHTTSAYSAALGQSSTTAGRILVVSHLMLHFPRFGFMFVTGLVLFLQYYHKPSVDWGQFFKKRYKGSGIPYLFFNFTYMAGMLLGAGAFTWATWLSQSGEAIIHGSQFYLYYILVVMQLYLLFPLLVKLFKRWPEAHGTIVLISGIIQVIFLVYAKYLYPTLDKSAWPYFLRAYGVNVFSYQFYFVAGAYTSIHYDQIKAFLAKYSHRFYWLTGLAAIGTLGLYYFNVNVLGESQHNANLIHQPIMMVYAVLTIGSVISISLAYARHRQEPAWQPFAQRVGLASKLSFGIYLLQTAPLALLKAALPTLYHVLGPNLLLMTLPLGYGFVLGGAYLLSYFCYKVPPFGILIGRPNHQQLFAKEGVYND